MDNSLVLGSSDAFLRALRSPKDPPTTGAQEKIELAAAAYSDVQFYVPGKASLIAEWALTALLKSNSKSTHR
jgi:hypothetical protein